MSPADSPESDTTPESRLRWIWRRSAPMRVAVAGGAVGGFIAAGLGSRLVMRIIALADPGTDGARTDAEATVGEFTFGGTFELAVLGTIAGVMGGLAYLGLRRWLPLPAAWRGLTYGVVTLVTVGQLLFDTNNADFQIFEPIVLAIALFSALFLVNGFIVAPLVDRFHPDPDYAVSLRVSRAVTGVLALVCVLGLAAYAGTVVEMIDDQGTCISALGGGAGCAVHAP